MRWFLLCALLAGCRSSPPPPPTVADLHFPVVVLFGNASVGTYPDVAALGTMLIAHLNAVTGPPPLIDSQLAIYRLDQLGSTHNGLWLMAHPTGSTTVHFELRRTPQSGPEAARDLLRACLDAQTWRHDLEQRRRDLATQQTLPGMLAIVQGGEK
jgi:hypothetical protein